MRSVLTILLAVSIPAVSFAESPAAFHRRAVDGRPVTVATGKSAATVVCFLGTECPLAKLYGPRLSDLAKEFAAQGVQVVGVMSNRQDSVDDIRHYIDQQSVRFPIVRDDGNRLADRFGATRTPEVFLLDKQLNVAYHGRVDDQYEPGLIRPEPKRQDLRVALEELLTGTTVSQPKTTALGCLIGKIDRSLQRDDVDNDITYATHVSRVLRQRCVECHRDGEIGPFAMDDYEEVAGWADTMLETIEDGRMPPWSADPEIGDFANARAMPETDKQILRDWIAGGLKRGDDAELPPPLEAASQWQLGRRPDVVIPMGKRPFKVPAQGTVEYQYFVVDPGFEEDTWISGAQIIPDERSVVHHAIAFIRPPDGIAISGIGWLTAYVPGQRLVDLPDGYARKVPAGSKIVFQMHYTTTGRAEEDLTKIGLLLARPDEVTHEMITLIGIDNNFAIPPGAADREVRAVVDWFPQDGYLLAIAPHMHYRGKSFEMYADHEGETEALLRVPRYDFNWQHSYELAKPLPLEGIDRLHFTATFDNSDGNPFNPDPGVWVMWGDQTWEEMAVVFLEVSRPLADGSKVVAAESPDEEETFDPAEREQRIEKFVDDYFTDFDANRDGIVQRSEWPIAVRRFARWRWDRDRDQQVSRDEVRAVGEERF